MSRRYSSSSITKNSSNENAINSSSIRYRNSSLDIPASVNYREAKSSECNVNSRNSVPQPQQQHQVSGGKVLLLFLLYVVLLSSSSSMNNSLSLSLREAGDIVDEGDGATRQHTHTIFF